MEITLRAVLEAARQRRAAVTAEVAGYVVLLVAQRLSASPHHVTSELVGLDATGSVQIAASSAASARDAESELRQLLASLLSLAPSPPPALKAAAERAAAGDLSALEAELLAALIPINHAASSRALARLYRETHKVFRGALTSVAAGGATPTPSPAVPVAGVRAMPPVTAAAPVVPSPSPVVARAASAATALQPEGLPASVRPPSSPAPAAAPSVTLPVRDGTPPEAHGAGDAPEQPPELDIDVDVEVAGSLDERPAAMTGRAAIAGAGAGTEERAPGSTGALEPSAQRSDVRVLLAGFLSHTRCEEAMAVELRRMIGLDAGGPSAVEHPAELR